MQPVYVAREDEFAERGRKVIPCGDGEIGVFRIEGEFYAWHNECPHRRGPVCQGRLYAQVEEPVAADGTVDAQRYKPGSLNLVCPWHGYEYDLRTGVNAAHPALRLRKAALELRDGAVYVLV